MPGRLVEVRIHGRGGQGVVTAAELLSVAAFRQGLHAQAFPSFGSERTGAPVVSFARLSDRPIRARDPIAEPDVIVVQDVTLLGQVAVLAGLRPDGYVLLNSPHTLDELGLAGRRGLAVPAAHVATVPATAISMRCVGRALPNVPLLGAFAALTGVVGLDAVVGAIEERFSGTTASRNVAAAREAYEAVLAEAGARRGVGPTAPVAAGAGTTTPVGAGAGTAASLAAAAGPAAPVGAVAGTTALEVRGA